MASPARAQRPQLAERASDTQALPQSDGGIFRSGTKQTMSANARSFKITLSNLSAFFGNVSSIKFGYDHFGTGHQTTREKRVSRMTGSGLSEMQTSDQTKLARGLKSRHIELIAIGGAIGVGLFLGSAKAIQNGGPGLILGYAFGGVVIFFIMRALGELLLYRPVAGSFVMYADEFVGPFAGFVTGWSYWFMWVVTGMAELTAIGVYVGYWFPDLPQWIPVLAALVVLYSANMLAVHVFGEMEFWFALIKVAMIVMLIVGGLAIILFRVGDLGATAGFSNLWSHGGLLPFGILGVLLTFQMVMFGFQGVELIGVTAGEAENPEVVLPRATNSIIYRILIFYIGALVVIMSLVPWNQLDPRISPFVVAFTRIGIPGAADRQLSRHHGGDVFLQ
jgi:AAT family amino acid transporter/D-serine/D-alanine/glycine transporter